MKLRKTLALFVFAGALANATLNYSEPGLDLTVSLSDLNSSDTAASNAGAAPIDMQDALEQVGSLVQDPTDNIVQLDSTWIELFHER